MLLRGLDKITKAKVYSSSENEDSDSEDSEEWSD